LIQLTLDNEKQAIKIMDMLLAKKRSPDRKKWLEANADRAIIP
jgi:topoisomerase-4 subunit B